MAKRSPALLLDLALVAVLMAAIAAAATWWVHYQGYTLYYGDAQAHLNIARRVLDSRTPGVWQIGTVWLPLPHLLMMPLAGREDLWRNGLAGAIPVSACFWLGGVLLFAAVRRLWPSRWAAYAAVAAFALNPNVLYLQATPMTEAVFLASLSGILYACVRFAQTPHPGWALLVGFFALAGAMTRYDGWFLLPFLAAFLLWKGGKRRWTSALLFCVVAGAGPLWWLAHNWWFWGDALEFYHGPYSAKAIYQRQLAAGMRPYPGDGDYLLAARYFLEAARLVAGWSLLIGGLLGGAVALFRGPRWAVALLALPALFYVQSMYGSGTPIFVPDLWPNAYYNTRYGVALFPLLCIGIAALVSAVPVRMRHWAAMAAVLGATFPWLLSSGPQQWVCWKESEVNSRDRRVWLGESATYLQRMYVEGGGILLSFGDPAGVLQLAGIPFSESLHEGNHPQFRAALNRPDLFLWEEWALCQSGDDVARAMQRARAAGMPYQRVHVFQAGRSAPLELWRRVSEFGSEVDRPAKWRRRLLPPEATSAIPEPEAETAPEDEEEMDADTVR